MTLHQSSPTNLVSPNSLAQPEIQEVRKPLWNQYIQASMSSCISHQIQDLLKIMRLQGEVSQLFETLYVIFLLCLGNMIGY